MKTKSEAQLRLEDEFETLISRIKDLAGEIGNYDSLCNRFLRDSKRVIRKYEKYYRKHSSEMIDAKNNITGKYKRLAKMFNRVDDTELLIWEIYENLKLLKKYSRKNT